MTKIRKKVFMEHDGAIDDLLSQLLLLTMKEIDVLGINITPADCYIKPAVESTYKILDLLDKTNVPIGRGDYHGVNAFPDAWRAKPEIINALPVFINQPCPIDPYNLPEATSLLEKTLSSSNEKITILITCPCVNLVQVLERNPTLKDKIESVIWMGDAFLTQGNVQSYQHNGTAEWNIYWDPINSAKLFAMELPLICIPLDVTNKVPVTTSFLSDLAESSDNLLANIAGQLWALTIDTIPNYYYIYFMWDVLATSFLDIPGAFTLKEIKAEVSLRPPNEGQTIISENGHKLRIATDVDKEQFYRYLKYQLTLNIPLIHD